MDGLTAAYFVAFVAGAGFSIVSWLLGAVGSHGDSGGDHGGTEAHGVEAHGDADVDVAGDTDASLEAGDDGGGHALEASHAGGHALPAGDGHALEAVHAHGHPAAGHAHGEVQHAGAGHGTHGLAAVVTPILNLSSLAAFSCVAGGAGFIARRVGAGVPLSLAIAIPGGLAAAYAIGGLIAYLRRESRFKQPTRLGGTLGTVLAPTSSEHLGEVMYLNDGVRTTLPARSTSTLVLPPGTEVVILDVKDGIARVGAATELLGIEPEPTAAPRRQLPRGEKEGPQ
jgi:membrane protein implicated in regulation of membrane protease activity